MSPRADVAEMLQAGRSQADIMRTLHVSYPTIKAAREALGLPAPGHGKRPPQDPAAALAARTEPVPGGHLRWTGCRASGGGTTLGINGRYVSGGHLTFELHHGRQPVGRVTSVCDFPGCMAPEHLADQVMRQEIRAARARTAPTLAAALARRTEPVDGGHVRWAGAGRLVVKHQGRTYAAAAAAFEVRYGRPPVGNALPGCGFPQCLAPDHVEDRPMRQRSKAMYAAIFGGTA